MGFIISTILVLSLDFIHEFLQVSVIFNEVNDAVLQVSYLENLQPIPDTSSSDSIIAIFTWKLSIERCYAAN